MSRQGQGLTDKLFWRLPAGHSAGSAYHCFKKAAPKRYVSLCQRFEIATTNGQSIDRPIELARCGLCDGCEATRRGSDESLPARIDPKRRAPRALRALPSAPS